MLRVVSFESKFSTISELTARLMGEVKRTMGSCNDRGAGDTEVIRLTSLHEGKTGIARSASWNVQLKRAP